MDKVVNVSNLPSMMSNRLNRCLVACLKAIVPVVASPSFHSNRHEHPLRYAYYGTKSRKPSVHGHVRRINSPLTVRMPFILKGGGGGGGGVFPQANR